MLILAGGLTKRNLLDLHHLNCLDLDLVRVLVSLNRLDLDLVRRMTISLNSGSNLGGGPDQSDGLILIYLRA